MLNRIVDIRPGERGRVMLSFGILMLVIASYTVVKAVRDGLFLTRFGITELSLLSMGLAVLTGVAVTVYLRTTGGIARNRLITATNIVIGVTLALLWFGLGLDGPDVWLPWVLYVWSSIFGIFTISQFWLLATDLFDAREGKRFFGFIGAGATLGGALGGLLSRALARAIGTRSLLFIAAGLLLLAATLTNLVWPLRRAPLPRPKVGAARRPRRRGGFRTVRRHPYVRLLALTLFLATVATTLLDWQFKGIAKAAFASRTDEMTAFFGALAIYLSAASFLLQTVATGWILRRFGVGVGLLALPVALLFGSSGILFYALLPGITRLMAASAAKVADGGLRFAIDKASMELMWMPVPPDIKEQGKAFVDTVMDRAGTGVTGVTWLALATLGLGSPERVHLVSLAVIGAVVLWLTVVLRAKKAYVGAFRQMLSHRRVDLDLLRTVDPESKQTLTAALASPDPRQVVFALYVVESWEGDLPDLSAVIAHQHENVCVEALKLLTRRGDLTHRQTATACLGHPSHRVREAAITYLRRTAPTGADPIIDRLAQEPQREGNSAAADAVDVIKLGFATEALAAADRIKAVLASADDQRRVTLLRVLAGAPSEMASALLAAPLGDSAPSVVNAALYAAGRAQAVGLAPLLADRLGHHRFRRAAAEALRRIGAPAVNLLVARLGAPAVQVGDQGLPWEARAAIIRTLGASGQGHVAPLLLNYVEHDPELSRPAIHALNRLQGPASLTFDADKIDNLVLNESRALHRDMLFLRRGSWSTAQQGGRPRKLLDQALHDRAGERVRIIFGLLGLRYPPADMRAALRGLRSPLKPMRAGAVEFLDNMLAPPIKHQLLPLLEDADTERFAETTRRVTGQGREERPALLRRLLAGADPLLRSVAAWTVGSLQLVDLRSDLERAAAMAPDWTARQARHALQQLKAKTTEKDTMGLTTIEKALKLQSVDVLSRASIEDLAHIAQIAEELEVAPKTTLCHEGDVADAFFVVVSGTVRLHRGDEEIGVLGPGEAFGSLALLDEAPRVASATTVETAVLLKVDRESFLDLLADRSDITQAILKAIVQRLRTLADGGKN